MAQVIGVRFREVGKVYYFDPLDNKFEKGDHVIVETVRGMESGEVALENSEVSDLAREVYYSSLLLQELVEWYQSRRQERESYEEEYEQYHGFDMTMM